MGIDGHEEGIKVVDLGCELRWVGTRGMGSIKTKPPHGSKHLIKI